MFQRNFGFTLSKLKPFSRTPFLGSARSQLSSGCRNSQVRPARQFSTFSDSQQKYSPPSGHNFKPKTCYYKQLNAGTSDDAATIRRQYLTLTKVYHPDVNPGHEEEYMRINEAYEILSNKELRKSYDLAQGIENPEWDEDQYLYVDFSPETKAVYSNMVNLEVEKMGEIRAAEKLRAIEEDSQDANYFAKKYFENPDFTTKPADHAFNFHQGLEDSRDRRMVKEKEFYYHYFPGSGKEYWETQEDVQANWYWGRKGLWELKDIFLLSGLSVFFFWYFNWDTKEDISSDSLRETKTVQKRGLVGSATPLKL